MSIENFYFPLFLLVVGVVVVWMFNRFRDNSGRSSGTRKTSGSRLSESAKLQRSIAPKGPAVPHAPNHGLKTQDAMWRTRTQRAKHGGVEDGPDALDGNVFQASYLDASEVWDQGKVGQGVLKEQAVRDTEYTGLDEYLAKKAAKEKLKKEQQEEQLSMTAMKYEPVENSSDEAEEVKKQGGFKP